MTALVSSCYCRKTSINTTQNLSCEDDYIKWYRDDSFKGSNPARLSDDIMVGASHFHPIYEQLYTVCCISYFIEVMLIIKII